MAVVTILVKWSQAREAISVDLASLKKGEQIEQTNETWSGKSTPHTYNVSSEFVPDRYGGGELTIYYRAQNNPHLTGSGYRWGHSIIQLDKDLTAGSATWHDGKEVGVPLARCKFSGRCSWVRFSTEQSVLSKKERETVERIARRQARFRKRLLMIDPKCAITGEREPTLLEAAHVVPAADNGSDIEANGFLLRADLHRLFDHQFFTISPKGEIKPTKRLQSQYYRTLLHDCGKLDDKTYARIKHAWNSTKKVRM
jgi:hypothetical protein